MPDAQGQKFPLISYSHSLFGGGENLWTQAPLLNDLASAGYIVVAHKSGGTNGAGQFSVDQIRSIEWAKDSELTDLIDFDSPVGILGYSMGGGATLDSGANVEAIAEHNIGAGVAVAPLTTEILTEFADLYDIITFNEVEIPVIPMLYAVMEYDNICEADLIRPNYDKSKSEQKVWANLAGASHMELLFEA
jgi:dienelactone hydrolase